MSDNSSPMRKLHISHSEDFVPDVRQSRRAAGRIHIKAKLTHHEIERSKSNPNGISTKKRPSFCEKCHSDYTFIIEILKDNQWWWHCNVCDNEWEPINNTDES